MKHIKPFPFPDASEHLADRRALLDKILTGVFVQSTLPDGRTYPPFTPDWVHSNDWRDYLCWLYAGKWHDSRGYKKVKYKGHTLYVHRVTYELMVGPVPDGHILDHLCKTRGCCQPRHLEPITQRKNIERGDNQNWLYRQSLTGRAPSVPDMQWCMDAAKREAAAGDAEITAGCAADFAEIERRVLAGVIGDQSVVLETHRPEHWTTPAMMQAHIDHAHPRFRTPLGALEPPKPFDIVTTNGKPARAVRVTDIPPDHLVIGRSAVAADAIQNDFRFPPYPAHPRRPAKFGPCGHQRPPSLLRRFLSWCLK